MKNLIVKLGRIASKNITVAGRIVLNADGELGENIECLQGSYRKGNGFIEINGMFEIKNFTGNVNDPEILKLSKDGYCQIV